MSFQNFLDLTMVTILVVGVGYIISSFSQIIGV